MSETKNTRFEMVIDYEQWCSKRTDVRSLIRGLSSSKPEQYIGFYLQKALGIENIEYQKKYNWLGNSFLDIYIPSLQLAIEYDGVYFHSDKRTFDTHKTALCRAYGIYVIHIVEKRQDESKSRKHNEISYYYAKEYKNISVAINELFRKINKKYGLSMKNDVDLERDYKDFIAYVQNKYYKKTVAYIWPESKDYWDNDKNTDTIFDVLCANKRTSYQLKCPYCGKNFPLHMKYFYERKSLIPCECEYTKIENDYEKSIKNFIETGKVEPFDDSLRSRRLYDRMAFVANNIWRCRSREEAELYKKLGFDSRYIDVYLSQI